MLFLDINVIFSNAIAFYFWEEVVMYVCPSCGTVTPYNICPSCHQVLHMGMRLLAETAPSLPRIAEHPPKRLLPDEVRDGICESHGCEKPAIFMAYGGRYCLKHTLERDLAEIPLDAGKPILPARPLPKNRRCPHCGRLFVNPTTTRCNSCYRVPMRLIAS